MSGAVRQQTRWLRGAGNTALAFDDILGGLDDVAAGYVERFGAGTVAAATDEDRRINLGAMSRRPQGTSDDRVTLRAYTGEYAGTGREFDRECVRKKTGALSLSLEGHCGRVDDSDEVSAALSVQYDVARGLSANLGVNHSRAEAPLAR